MPTALKRRCNQPGCAATIASGSYCQEHTRQREAKTRARIGSSTKRGYGRQWRKASKAYLQAHPLCVECGKAGRITPATVVDHIQPHRDDHELFWSRENWQPLCAACHGRKTATKDGGYGRKGVRG